MAEKTASRQTAARNRVHREGLGVTAGEPLAIATESVRTLIAKVRLSVNKRLETEPIDARADSARKLETSQHNRLGFAIVTVNCDFVGYVLPILEGVELYHRRVVQPPTRNPFRLPTTRLAPRNDGNLCYGPSMMPFVAPRA